MYKLIAFSLFVLFAFILSVIIYQNVKKKSKAKNESEVDDSSFDTEDDEDENDLEEKGSLTKEQPIPNYEMYQMQVKETRKPIQYDALYSTEKSEKEIPGYSPQALHIDEEGYIHPLPVGLKPVNLEPQFSSSRNSRNSES